MMVKGKSISMRDLQVQGKSLMKSPDDVNSMSPSRKKTKRLNRRSKSLTDAPKKREGISNQSIYYNGDIRRQPYINRVPTQDDIYKIIDETADVIRPSTSDDDSKKRLSPYTPLPAIGTKFNPIKSRVNPLIEISESNTEPKTNTKIMGTMDKLVENTNSTMKIAESKIKNEEKHAKQVKFDTKTLQNTNKNATNSIKISQTNQSASLKSNGDLKLFKNVSGDKNACKSNSSFQNSSEITCSEGDAPDGTNSSDDSARKLVREGTYNVLNPKFVRGPTDIDSSPSKHQGKEKAKKKSSNPLEASSTTIMFGPRLQNEEDLLEEDLTAIEFPFQQQNSVNTNTSQGGDPSTVIQKLYYRNSEDTINKNNSLTEHAASGETNMADPTGRTISYRPPQVQQTFWF
ncbi:hypothetical protein L9F63_018387 [Diploptera punctata]|uniref:Uncharacterized protein n=1 Tax=Diploptera punctata TaxID=6984 RepID=A0AAD8EF97_DIPPU|nr:hypothetical protein L9F63_018387 [Diploptera punctata]